jgi:hypothetical protein
MDEAHRDRMLPICTKRGVKPENSSRATRHVAPTFADALMTALAVCCTRRSRVAGDTEGRPALLRRWTLKRARRRLTQLSAKSHSPVLRFGRDRLRVLR